MTMRPFAKPSLLRGCALAALISGASFAAQSAQAQGIQASPTVVQGTVSIDTMVPGETRVFVDGTDAVVDWFPDFDEANGQPFTFLPDGNTAIFQGTANFAILNRILPDGTNSPAQFDGLVQAFLTDFSGIPIGPGGFVAFYSPTGIIVGSTGRFEVPQLMLTSQDVDLASFSNFANGTGPLLLNGSSGFVDIQAGASLTGTPENSFLIVASPQITMAGDAYYNGSIAYVATTAVQLTHSSGLFDIIVQNGSTGGLTIDHSGSSGGPSSTGAADEHVIYGVTAGAISGGGVSMLFGGNLGFDPAVAAGVVNGDIILSADFNVTGRTVDGDDNRQGAGSFFDGRSLTSGVQADIVLNGVTATSNLLAIATGQTNLDAVTVSSSFAGDLTLVGRQQAVVNADAGQQIIVGGDLFVSARSFGTNSLIFTNENAVGGFAAVRSGIGSLVSVTGQTMVAASALPGINPNFGTIGSGAGGQAQILADGGTIDLTGDVRMEAFARTDQTGAFAGNGLMSGGSAQFVSVLGGTLAALGGLSIDAGAQTPSIAASDDTFLNDAAGGDILIGTDTGGGLTRIAGNVVASAASVSAPADILTGTAATVTGGNVQISAIDSGIVDLQGDVTLDASSSGGTVISGGNAGQAIGGRTAINIANADITVGGQLVLDSSALASGGFNGGAAQGGFADMIATAGVLSVGGILTVAADAQGGNVNTAGAGGNATSGDIAILADANGQIIIAGASGAALGSTATGGSSIGGTGGAASGGSTAVIADGAGAAVSITNTLVQTGTVTGGFSQSGAGGNAVGGLHEAAAVNGGIVAVTGVLSQDAQSIGGNGSAGGSAIGAGLNLFAGNSSQINLGSYTADGGAFGGAGLAGDGGQATGATIAVDIDGGIISLTGPLNLGSIGTGGASTGGVGGAGFGGDVQVQNALGTLDAAATVLTINAIGVGGDALTAGQPAGNGRGGDVVFATFAGANTTIDSFILTADGIGGTGANAAGGSGDGGTATASVSGDGGQLVLAASSSIVSASGTGGASTATGFAGGTATGGTATILTSEIGNLQSGGTLAVRASAVGGGSLTSGGTATGGDASIAAELSGVIVATDLDVRANGSGGDGPLGGTGTGGNARVQADAATLAIGGGAQVEASGRGGEGATGGAAGDGFGGTSSLLVTGGTASFDAQTNVSASGDGGEGIDGASGGNGQGGTAITRVDNGALVSTAGIIVRAQGAGVGTNGGSGTGGTVTLSAVNNSSFDAAFLIGTASGFGAFSVDGNGGAGQGGDVSLTVDNNSAATVDTFALLESIAFGGSSELVGGTAGTASSGGIALDLTNSGTLSAAQTQLRSTATGGSESGAATGIAGADATSGAINVTVTDSTLTTALDGSSTAIGGTSTSSSGGTASAGDVLLTASNGLLDLTGASLLASDAAGGTGNGGGAATSGNAGADLSGTVLNAAALAIRSDARAAGAGPGGDAAAGNAFLATTGSGSVTLAALSLTSNAEGVGGAVATSGTARFDVDLGLATITDLTLNTDTAGAADGTPGQLLLTSTGGLIETDTITISALGANPGPQAQISASDGGQIGAAVSLDANATGDIAFTTANGGLIIGGADPGTLTATFNVQAGGTISLDGDDAGVGSIRALDSTYTSADLAIGADTQFGGGSVTLVSTNTAEQAVLGGTTAGAGYSLLQAEVDAIRGDTLSVILPDVAGTLIDAVVGDLSFIGTGTGTGTGSGNSGFSRVGISVGGSLDIIGALSLTSAGAGDVLALGAAQQVQITLPTGSISIDDGSGVSGLLQIGASRIVAADAALIAQIAADPASQAIADALLDNGGAASPSSFVSAGRVELSASELVLTQNTGANDIYGGITVGAGGLLITSLPGATALLQVIAFGLRDVAGAQTTNDDWFALVEFSADPASTYSSESVFNNCNIAAGACPVPPEPEPVDPIIPDINHRLIEEPLAVPEIVEDGATSDFRFGVDFPRLLDSALISEEEVIDEPVTSGGDSAVQALIGGGAIGGGEN
ncbi:beta strand repeat-containing protein [Aurantiacibacter marinus]|uniref:Autotransporter domain-containing protein n=1 Tax=Aurantiacibacter marinus TaxID=874156 RepID=A0A0H0XW34_9SPHN|nr:hypothetical protein [Aurantiacibacter marinus]KLI64500.1 hypothetical protein AAV99_02625 [Aurantiacibacter marinus]